MKKINIIAIVVLSIIAIYLLYKLIFVEEWNRMDNILLIIMLAGGIINSSLIIARRKRNQLKEKQNQL